MYCTLFFLLFFRWVFFLFSWATKKLLSSTSSVEWLCPMPCLLVASLFKFASFCFMQLGLLLFLSSFVFVCSKANCLQFLGTIHCLLLVSSCFKWSPFCFMKLRKFFCSVFYLLLLHLVLALFLFFLSLLSFSSSCVFSLSSSSNFSLLCTTEASVVLLSNPVSYLFTAPCRLLISSFFKMSSSAEKLLHFIHTGTCGPRRTLDELKWKTVGKYMPLPTTSWRKH